MPSPRPALADPPLGRPAAWALVAGAACLSACGSTSPGPSRATPTLVALRGLPAPTPVPPGAQPCRYRVADALGAVARRIYAESASGTNARDAIARVQRARGLAPAVAAGDRAAVRAIVARLAPARIARLQVARGSGRASRLLADSGGGPVLAPVSGVLRDARGHPVGSFMLSVQSVSAYTGVTEAVTGARVLIRAGTRALAGSGGQGPARVPDRGPVPYRGRSYQVYAFSAQALPSGPARISLLIPPSALGRCGSSATLTEAGALAAAAQRIYAGELRGRDVSRALQAVSGSAGLRRAVAANNPSAARAAIAALIGRHLHIVRLRVTWAGQAPIDVGGPTVLAPVSETLPHVNGGPPAAVELSIQDDHGYTLLANRFTGADVLVRQGTTQIMGTLTPGPARVPDRGDITYQGTRYLAYSFAAQAFPSGALRISLLYALG